MKIKLLLLILIIFSFSAKSQTSVPGGSVSGTWTLAGSPYTVYGSIMIPNGSTLTIQPGVVIKFNGSYKLLVLGRLLAIGTTTDSIIFSAVNISTGWRGIRFDNTPTTNDTSRIMYARLTYGRATGPTPDDNGGAFYFDNYSKAIISNCLIANNMAKTSGGSIYCNNSSPVITDNVITKSTVPNSGYVGGGIACYSLSSPKITNNIINACSAGTGGGISCNGQGMAVISNNTFTYDTAYGSYGGAILSYNSSPTITENAISNNYAKEYGGGIHVTNNSVAVITHNIISANATQLYGGGGISTLTPSTTISYNKICNNVAGGDGGGIFSGATGAIFNNLIANNSAIGGGGICFFWADSTINTNNTIVNNSAIHGGALYCDNSDPKFRNCIFSGNTDSNNMAQIFLNDEPADPAFYYCDVVNAALAIDANGNFFTGPYINNISANPVFASASAGAGNNYDGLAANWTLQNTSPCIDAGDPAGTYPATDLAGNIRVQGLHVDIGAYESPGVVGIEELMENGGLMIYPNPFSVSAIIELNPIVKEAELTIYNLTGQRVRVLNHPAGNKITITKDGLPAGIYFIYLYTNEGISKGKIVITD